MPFNIKHICLLIGRPAIVPLQNLSGRGSRVRRLRIVMHPRRRYILMLSEREIQAVLVTVKLYLAIVAIVLVIVIGWNLLRINMQVLGF